MKNNEVEEVTSVEENSSDVITQEQIKHHGFLDRFFHISERGSSYGREIIAGILVFLSMIYILPVNTSILGDSCAGGEALQMGIFAGTAIVSFICTMIMGIIAGYPVMLSAGMGLNATVAFTVCASMGYTYPEAMTLVFVAGALFMILSLTPARTWIINSIPNGMKRIISAGLGFFICLVGLKGSGIIAKSDSTIVTLGELSDPCVLLALGGIVLAFVFAAIPNKYVKRFSILLAMGIVAIVGIILHYACGIEAAPSFDTSKGWIAFSGLKDVFGICFSKDGFIKVFTSAESYAVIFVLIFVNLFDTTATLVSVGRDAGFMDEEGQLIGGKKAMLSDAVGAVISAPFGCSPVTSFAESAVGIEVGGRTGLSACVTGVFFLLSLLIYPVFSVFSSYAITACALVSVGASIVAGNLKDFEWDDKIMGVTGFITIIMIILTYSLSDGIGFGVIIYVLMMLCSGRAKEVKIPLYIVALLFVVSFVLKAVVL